MKKVSDGYRLQVSEHDLRRVQSRFYAVALTGARLG